MSDEQKFELVKQTEAIYKIRVESDYVGSVVSQSGKWYAKIMTPLDIPELEDVIGEMKKL